MPEKNLACCYCFVVVLSKKEIISVPRTEAQKIKPSIFFFFLKLVAFKEMDFGAPFWSKQGSNGA